MSFDIPWNLTQDYLTGFPTHPPKANILWELNWGLGRPSVGKRGPHLTARMAAFRVGIISSMRKSFP